MYMQISYRIKLNIKIIKPCLGMVFVYLIGLGLIYLNFLLHINYVFIESFGYCIYLFNEIQNVLFLKK